MREITLQEIERLASKATRGPWQFVALNVSGVPERWLLTTYGELAPDSTLIAEVMKDTADCDNSRFIARLPDIAAFAIRAARNLEWAESWHNLEDASTGIDLLVFDGAGDSHIARKDAEGQWSSNGKQIRPIKWKYLPKNFRKG